jgi:hypothetical protein
MSICQKEAGLEAALEPGMGLGPVLLRLIAVGIDCRSFFYLSLHFSDLIFHLYTKKSSGVSIEYFFLCMPA